MPTEPLTLPQGDAWIGGMKAILTALFVTLLMVGCASEGDADPVDSPKAIDLDDKETRDKIIAEAINWDGLQYRGKKGERLAYAPNEQTPYTGWAKEMHDNGKIKYLGQFKDGKRDGLFTGWYENGQKQLEANYKDGKIISAVVWKPNGEKCPVTNIKDGNGIKVWYEEDGTEGYRHTYKDGEQVFDYPPN